MSDSPRTPLSEGVDIESVGAESASVAAELCAAAMEDGWSSAAIRSELERPGSGMWLARPAPAGPPVGLLLVSRVLDVVSLHLIAVAASQRRRGVARALFARLVEHARDAARIELEVRASNEPAIAFYRKLGFERVGRRPRYYGGGEDALLMNLELGESVET